MVKALLQCAAVVLGMFSLSHLQLAMGAKIPDATLIWRRELIDPTASRKERTPDDLAGLGALNDKDFLIFQNVKSTSSLASRKLDPNSSFQLRVSVADIDSGEIETSKEWPTSPGDWDAAATSVGAVIRTNEILRFLSSNLLETRTQQISPPVNYTFLPHSEGLPQVLGFRILTSADRSRLLLLDESSGDKHVTVMDPTTLRVVSEWIEKPQRLSYVSISSNSVAAIDPISDSVVIKQFGAGEWNRIRRPGKCVAAAKFVNDEVIASGCGEIYLQNLAGELLFHTEIKSKKTLEKIAVSADARSLAAAFDNLRGGFLDTDIVRTGMTVVIYDLPRKRERSRVAITPLPFMRNFDLALSPDGSKLVVLSDRSVAVYSVPQAP